MGAVVVVDDVIVGEGYTSPYGGAHAEVNAINSVEDKSLLTKATIYVTLEPCVHFGKTPPCADLIVKSKIPNVVIGVVDTNSLVAGKGIERLEKAGCNVTVGVLEDECLAHHKRFFTVQNKKRPYIILKWAETQDSFIAPLVKDEQKPVWISNSYSQQLVHKWRAEEHAILVGTNTVIADNPSLTVRSWSGNNPVRVVLDRELRISKDITVLDGKVKTIVITDKSSTPNIDAVEVENTCYETIDFSKPLPQQICKVLHEHQIQSIIIEGGAQTLQTFIDANVWDEARVFVGNTVFKEGVERPVLKARLVSKEELKGDVLKIYTND